MKFCCKLCNIELNNENTARNGTRNGKIRYRKECKKCNSKITIANAAKDIIKRRTKAVLYSRTSGKVKLYPCERCSSPCYKKYKRAFCTDMCRFMSYVTVTDNCWIWNGAKNKKYGILNFRNRNSMPAHRMSYILFRGEIPDGILACHTCDNPPCVNPQHIFLGTTQHNTEDMMRKGRSMKGEKHPLAKLTEDDILKIRNLHKQGMKQTKIAEMFNVLASYINCIIKRRTWKHI
jgi:hypothetical protein